MDVLTVAVKPRRAVEQEPAGRLGAVAKYRTPAYAVFAPAAVRPEVEDDRLAGFELGAAGPDPLHHPGRLVAEDHGKRHRPLALHHVVVGVADPRRGDAYQHLPVPRLVEIEGLDDQRRVGFVKNGGLDFHESSSR